MPTKIQVTILLRGSKSLRNRIEAIKKDAIKRKADMISVPRIKNRLSLDVFLNEYLPRG